MQFSYQECYDKFVESYGSFANWPAPFHYQNWYMSLATQYQQLYLPSNNYCQLYQWARQLQKNLNKKQKLSRGQKRKLKKKQLQQQYKKQKALIGKWVQKQRKDLVNELQKIQKQQKKQKQKKQKRLNHLIEIHKEVYKHHLKKKTAVQNPHKRVNTKNKKKRISMIKKMKIIFQSRREKIMDQIKNKQQSKTKQNLKQADNKESKQQTEDLNKKQQRQQKRQNSSLLKQKQLSSQNELTKEQKPQSNPIEPIQSDQQYEDIQDQTQNFIQGQKTNSVIPNVSFPITQIEYTNIGKLAGKIYNGISLREWVTNIPNAEVQDIALQLINRLAYKQAIKKVNNPQKAKKIIVAGLKQSKRTLTTILQNKKSKCIVVALNIQRNNLVKGVDDELQKCITLGQQLRIPVIHTSTRSKLGRAFTGKFGPRLSIISIINYEGYQDYMQKLLQAWQKSCVQYKKL